MAKISKNTINNLREFMSRGCKYSGTQEIVNDLMNESLREMGAKVIEADDVSLIDWDDDTIGTLDELPTVTAWDHNSVVTSNLIQMNNNCDGKDIRKPIPTITAGDGHFGEVRAFLVKYYGCGTGQDIEKPLDTITAHDRFGLVTIHGVDYQIVDIGLRMLEPKELYGCQGFPEDYIIDKDYTGEAYPRSEQVKRCGNAVCPPIPAALVKANLPELCVAKRTGNIQISEERNGQLKFA